MNRMEDERQEPAASATDDSRVIRALHEYQAALKAGHKPNRHEFQARYPEIAAALAECLDGLEFVHGVGPHLSQPGPGPFATAADDVQPAAPLGDYQMVREVGRGGMGVVYEAVQISLGRRVALKVLPFASALDPRQLQRFKNEAQAAAHLHHTNIVPVHAVGCERGVHFYAMQFIEGHTLAALIGDLRALAGLETPDQAGAGASASALADEFASGRWAPGRASPGEELPTGPYTLPRGPSPAVETAVHPAAALSTERSTRSPAFFRTVANLGVQAAEALEHAHQLGVIHRDIKPANLMVDSIGHLWIADFGLARLGTDAGLTMTGDLLGTIRYMSPEQALGQRVTVDARTDVYSLGVTLYEVLALEPAYNGRNREEVLRQIAFEEPRPLSRLNKGVPAELETIVLKAMAKNPDERYATAQEVADDLRRFLEDRPIKARRPTLRQRAVKWARRHKTVMRAAVVVTVLAAVGLAVGTVLIVREQARTAEARAQAATDLAAASEEATNRLETQLYYQRIALAEREWEANNLGRCDQLLDECPAGRRGWEWHYLKRLRYKPLSPLRHEAAVLCVAFSPNGARIASSSQDGMVKVWDAQTGQKLWQVQAHENNAECVALQPDGQRLVTGDWDGTAKIWDAKTDHPIHILPGHNGHVKSVTFSPDGQILAVGGGKSSGEIKLWDTTTWAEVRTLRGHNAFIRRVVFSPDGQRLATASIDRTAKVWDARTGQEQLTFRGHTESLWCVAFSPDGKRLASGAGPIQRQAEGELKVWDSQTGRELLPLRGHTGWVASVAFSPDGRRLASGSLDQTIKLWDLTTGQEALSLRGHLHNILSVSFSPDGHRLVSASYDHTVRIWDARPLSDEPDPGCLTLRGHTDAVTRVAFSPDDRRVVVSSSEDHTVRFWDAWAGRQLHVLSYDRPVVSMALSPKGHLLATTAGRDIDIQVWNVATREKVKTLQGHTGNPRGVAFSSDGKQLVSGGYDRCVRVWDVATGKQIIEELHDHNWVINGLAFSPDDRHVASVSADGTVRIWDLTAKKEIDSSPLRHTSLLYCVAFSPDGARLASAGMDRTVKIWDTKTWIPLHVLRDATGGVWSLAFSPDGKRVAWGGTDGTVKVWDEASEEIHTLRGHTGWVRGVAFSPDGNQIASASDDGTVKIWDAPPVQAPPGPATGNPNQ